MQRYFVTPQQMNQNNIILTDADFHHITRVMRMSIGSNILCSVSDGKTAKCSITEITNDSVVVNVLEWIVEKNELPVRVAIASGLPKGDKLEMVLQKGTELGAFQFVPFMADRSIVKWDAAKAEKKVERWKKIVKEAAEQAHRGNVPNVKKPLDFNELIKYSSEFKFKLVAYEEEAKAGEKKNLQSEISKMQEGDSVFFLFGPEGGLTAKEIDILRNNGFITCSLGPRILRTETAPLYALSVISYYFELLR